MTDLTSDSLLNGRYRLGSIIGQGGMAVVWRAEDSLLGRTVAIKVLRDQYAQDPEFLERFRSEARSAAALNDPGVVSVYDVGADEGRNFLIMEYVAGRDLKQVIREEAPLDPARAVTIAAGLARAVGQAHAIGMVHRYIKPQNVLVTPDGRMKVADFGIARAIAAAGMTAPGIVLGTVHYLAPEQAAGEPATLTTDVYSLGVVLYEMLTGQVPFKADSGVGVAMKIVHETPEPVDRLNPRVPTALAAIVARAMAREPGERYPNAAAMAEAIDGYARWSEQLTAPDFRAVAPAGVTGAAGATDRTARPVAHVAPAKRPPGGVSTSRGGAVPAPAGPLLDRTGLLLGLVALAALAMLIPLWAAVAAKFGSPSGATLPDGLGVIAGLGAQSATPTPTPPPTVALVTVPAVERHEEKAAVARLRAEGLGVSIEYDPDASVPVGLVIRQAPEAGGVEPVGTVVRLVVSSEALATVPDVGGDYETVADALRGAGLVPRSPSYQWGGTPGMVIRYDPGPGQRVPYGAPVTIIVASGSVIALGVDFDDNLFLDSIDLAQKAVAPGETLSFTPRWQAVGPVGGEYAARAMLRGPGGIVVSQVEKAPIGTDGRPTNAWAAGESVGGQAFDLSVPPGTAAGEYELWLDVYRVGNPAERLAVRGAGVAGAEDSQVRISEIEVGGG